MGVTNRLQQATGRGFIAGTALALLILAPTPSLSAGVYKWVDADGKVHFTDKPPPEVEAESVRTNTTRDEHTAERLKQYTEQASENAAKRAEAKAAAAAEQARKKAEAEKCEASRKELADLQRGNRQQFVNADGEREYVGEERRQQWMATARENIKKLCK